MWSRLRALLGLAPKEAKLDAVPREGAVAVMFWDGTCGFCRGFERHWRRWDAPEGVQRVVVDITSGQHPAWSEHRIHTTPTVALFDEGKLVWRKDGRRGMGLTASDVRSIDKQSRALTKGR